MGGTKKEQLPEKRSFLERISSRRAVSSWRAVGRAEAVQRASSAGFDPPPNTPCCVFPKKWRQSVTADLKRLVEEQMVKNNHMRSLWRPVAISITVEASQISKHACRFISIKDAKTAAFSQLWANVHQQRPR